MLFFFYLFNQFCFVAFMSQQKTKPLAALQTVDVMNTWLWNFWYKIFFVEMSVKQGNVEVLQIIT